MDRCKWCGKEIQHRDGGWYHPMEITYDSIGHSYYSELCDITSNMNWQKAEPLNKLDNFTNLYNILNGKRI